MAAIEATEVVERPVQFDHVLASGAPMQPVYILGHQRKLARLVPRAEGHESAVPGMGDCITNHAQPHR